MCRLSYALLCYVESGCGWSDYSLLGLCVDELGVTEHGMADLGMVGLGTARTGMAGLGIY